MPPKKPTVQEQIAKDVRAIMREEVKPKSLQREVAKETTTIINEDLTREYELQEQILRAKAQRLKNQGKLDLSIEQIIPKRPKRITQASIDRLLSVDPERTQSYYEEYLRLGEVEQKLRQKGYFSSTPESILPKIPNVVTEASLNRLLDFDIVGKARLEEKKYEVDKIISKVASEVNNLEDAYRKALDEATDVTKKLVQHANDNGIKIKGKFPKEKEKVTKNDVARQLLYNNELADRIHDKILSRQIAEEEKKEQKEQKEIERKQKQEEREQKKKEKEKNKTKKEDKALEAIEKATDIEQPKVEEPETPEENIIETDSKIIQDAKEEIEKENEESEQKIQEAVDNVEEAQKEVNDVIKPKELSDEQIEDITDTFYEESDKEQGEGNPPSEAVEIIMNVVDELGGADEQTKSDFSDRLYSENIYSEDANDYYNFSEDETTAGNDYFWYDTGEMKSVLDDVLRRLENWQPSPQWSSNLQSIKRRDVSSALKMINSAIENQGILQTARNLWEHASELDDLISEIMYRGSGSDFLQGRDAVNTDLIRLQNILLGHTMSFEEAADLADQMESEEFYDDVME